MHDILRVADVSHRYRDTVALRDVSLSVSPGECLALLGPNGAGKTTLVNLVTGLLSRQAGSVTILGGDPRRAATRRALGVVQQTIGFPRTMRVAELVRGAAIRAGAPPSAVSPVLVEVGLSDLRRRRVTKLSGGQQQRLQLAMALVSDPGLLILDEPTTGLDAASRRDFWRTLAARRDRGTGVLLATHQLDEAAAVADRVVVLSTGSIVAEGTPAEVTSRLPDRLVSARTTVAAATVRSLPGTISVSGSRNELQVSTTEPEALVRRLLELDPGLDGLRVEGASLEQAVLTLTTASHLPADTTQNEEVPA